MKARWSILLIVSVLAFSLGVIKAFTEDDIYRGEAVFVVNAKKQTGVHLLLDALGISKMVFVDNQIKTLLRSETFQLIMADAYLRDTYGHDYAKRASDRDRFAIIKTLGFDKKLRLYMNQYFTFTVRYESHDRDLSRWVIATFLEQAEYLNIKYQLAETKKLLSIASQPDISQLPENAPFWMQGLIAVVYSVLICILVLIFVDRKRIA